MQWTALSGHDQDIPAETYRSDSAGLTLLSPSRNYVSFLELYGKETASYTSSPSTSAHITPKMNGCDYDPAEHFNISVLGAKGR